MMKIKLYEKVACTFNDCHSKYPFFLLFILRSEPMMIMMMTNFCINWPWKKYCVLKLNWFQIALDEKTLAIVNLG